MSGYKHTFVTISEEDYRRLHEKNMQNYFSSLPANHSVYEPSRLEAIERMLSLFTERQKGFEESITKIGNDLSEVEASSAHQLLDYGDASLQQYMDDTETMLNQLEDQTNRLQKHIFDGEDSLQQQMASGIEFVRHDTTAVIQEFSEKLNMEIRDIRHQHASQLADIQQQVSFLSDENYQKDVLAHSWLESARAVREFIESNYDHRRFIPEVFDALDFQLQQAEENLANNMPEAALVDAQHVYTECSIKRLELEELTTQWQTVYLQALHLVDDLLADLLVCRTLPAIDTSGKELDINIDLYDWSKENYLALKKTVLELRSNLHKGAGHLTTVELTTIISRYIPELHQALSNLIYKARWEVVNSQIRINIADIAILALEGQGFRINEHGFKDSNMKDAYFIDLYNVEGSHVIIQVNPLPGMDAGTDLSIESHDRELRTDSELRSRSLEITRSLARYGLRVGPLLVGQNIPVVRTGTPPIPKSLSGMLERLPVNNHD